MLAKSSLEGTVAGSLRDTAILCSCRSDGIAVLDHPARRETLNLFSEETVHCDAMYPDTPDFPFIAGSTH